MPTLYVNTAGTVGTQDGTTNTPGSSGTAAFATLRQAIDSFGASLSAQTTIYCTGTAPDTGNVNQTAWDFTTTTANYLQIIGEQSSNHFSNAPTGKFDTSKYRLTATNANGLYSNVPSHVRIEGIQIQVTVNDGLSYVGLRTTNANQTVSDIDMRVSKCIVKAIRTSGNVTAFSANLPSGAGQSKFFNCIGYNCTQGVYSDFASTEVYNCTLYNSATYNYIADAAFLLVNCLGSAGAAADFGGTFHANSKNNASSDGSAPGSSARTNQTFSFFDSANGDFHLLVSDSGAKDFGLTDPGSGLFSDDIDGQERTGSWDIGADEFIPTPQSDVEELMGQMCGF